MDMSVPTGLETRLAAKPVCSKASSLTYSPLLNAEYFIPAATVYAVNQCAELPM
jgi:hypothetical protein